MDGNSRRSISLRTKIIENTLRIDEASGVSGLSPERSPKDKKEKGEGSEWSTEGSKTD